MRPRKPPEIIELNGEFVREFFRRDDFYMGIVTSIDGDREIKIKGSGEPGELVSGLRYRFYGNWHKHPTHGESFAVDAFAIAKPHDRQGVVLYLQQAPGIGQATAAALWDRFQSDAVRILREKPDVAVAAVNSRYFGLEKAQKAARALQVFADLEDVSQDLLGLLTGYGFPRGTAKEALLTWSGKAPEVIRRNPYALMAFRGCGFLRCDAMYLNLGLPADRMKRQSLCIWHRLASDTEGHTWFPMEEAKKAVHSKVAGTKVNPDRALKLASRARMIEMRGDCEFCGGKGSVDSGGSEPWGRWIEVACPACGGSGGSTWIAEAKLAKAERYIAEKIAQAMEESLKTQLLWPSPESLTTLSDHQREKYAEAYAMQSLIWVLRGSPGTGKTFLAAAVIEALVRAVGVNFIGVAAPTGKAAVRLTDALAGYNLPLQAMTHHRMLGVETSGDGGWTFRHNERNPLPYRVLVLDEQSIKDTPMEAHLLAARPRGCHVLLIGDTNQLPPVGPGAPLRDMIRAGVPSAELTEIQRNAGTIVRVCAKIRDGERWFDDQELAPDATSPKNLKVIGTSNNKQSRDRIVEMVRKIKQTNLHLADKQGTPQPVDPIWDVQVIVAVNAKSDLSRKELNRLLQMELNPGGASAEGNPFRVGDKVIQLANGFLPAHSEDGGDAGQLFVANGDQGRVLSVQPKVTVVEFRNPTRLVKVPRSAAKPKKTENDDAGSQGGQNETDNATDTGCDLDLAYAVTCHKMQGSQAKVVIVALDEYPGAKFVCSREWLYTAISRAEKLCFLIGKRTVATAMCERIALEKRKTFLAEEIRQATYRIAAPLTSTATIHTSSAPHQEGVLQ